MDSKKPTTLTATDLLTVRRSLPPEEQHRIRTLLVKELQGLREEQADVLQELRRTDHLEDARVTWPLIERRDELDSAIDFVVTRIDNHDQLLRGQDRAAPRPAPREARLPRESYTHGFLPDPSEAEMAPSPSPAVPTTAPVSAAAPHDDTVWPGEPRGFDPKLDC